MKMTMRRVVATIAGAGLLLVGIPAVAAPASAAVAACAPGSTCEGTLTGSLGASPFKIQVPSNFNGQVLMYFHGYRFAGPIPAAFAGPSALNLMSNPSYAATSVPAFAAAPPLGFGSAVAYASTNVAEIAPSAAVAENLLAQGYALAGPGYARQGWAAAEGVEAGEQLIAHINSGAIKGVKGIRLWGSSLGALISSTVAERNPGKVAGVLPLCAQVVGPEQAFSAAMTALFTWKTLIAPTMKVANYAPGQAGYAQALGDLGTVLTTLGGVAAGRVTVSPVNFAVPQANLLAGLMAGVPTVSSVYDGQTVNPAFATLGTAAGLAGGYQPASAGASSAAAMLQNIGGTAAIGILGRYDLEMRARAAASIPDNESANFNDNVNVSYTDLLSVEQRGEFGDTLSAVTNRTDNLNAMLSTLDASRGNATVRFPANPKAVAAVAALPKPTGKYGVPTVLMTTTYDPLVFSGNTGEMYDLLKASYAKSKAAGPFKVGVYYTVPPENGWTQFDPGAKGPNAAASIAALGGSGVGHCVFTDAQLLSSVAALGRMVNAKTGKQVKAVNRLMWGTAGVNGDGAYAPPPLKRPNG